MMLIPLLFLTLIAPPLPFVDEKIIDQAIKPHTGKVVVLNFWATWCGPCREEFPDLVRLSREHRGQLVVVSVSMDEPEDAGKAAQFLASQKSNFTAYIRGFQDFQAFVNAIDPGWMGGIPATFIFDKTGKRVFSHEGLVTYEELKRATAPHL